MKDFEVKTEKRKRSTAKFAAAAVMTALLGITTHAAARRIIEMAGDVMPAQISREEAVREMDEHFEKVLNITMRHDVRLNVRNGSTNISFVADGYNSEKKIAYEFIIYGYTNAAPADILTDNEQKLIDGYKVGDTWIVTIRGSYYNAYELDTEFDRFFTIYTNR